jgi:RNA polymerase sigma-70 factor (ECF subfamily)
MSAELVDRWRHGDQQAAEEFVRLYTSRLLALARSRLWGRLGRRVDPEDVVQSAFQSFFRISREVTPEAPAGGTWQLLATITLRALYREIEHHRDAQRRSIDREAYFTDPSSRFDPAVEVVAREPSPAKTAELSDDVRGAMHGLNPLHRQMVELTLEGHGSTMIARVTSRSDRMVRLVIEQFRKDLQERLAGQKKVSAPMPLRFLLIRRSMLQQPRKS